MDYHGQPLNDQGFPTPEQIAQSPEPVPILGPTFIEPSMAMPELQPGDAQSGAGMDYVYDPLDADPLLPDLQRPVLEPEASMTTRPGDLDPQALQAMHNDMTYRQLDGASYPQVYMDGSGMNNRRRRDFTLLMHGLDAEEQGKHYEAER
jgi:hypothetical protein